MSEKYLGFGTLFQLKISGTFQTVAAVRDSSMPELSVEDVDITNQDSPETYLEFKPGFIDPGEASVELIYDPANATHLELLAAIKARTVREWKVVFPDGSDEEFSGYLKQIGREIPVKDLMTMSVTIKATGAPT